MKTTAFTGALLTYAAYLFFAENVRASTQTDIVGPVGSQVFGESVKVLPNGNFIVLDPQYSAPGPITGVGRVYLYNGQTLALINTMTGTATNDVVGSGGVTVLANGDYVIASSGWNNNTGAVTRCSATSGCPATISAANSLVGSTNDGVGRGVTALPSGNYVVQSPYWSNAATSTALVGAVTWCSGSSPCVGAVSTANSLIGSTAGDQVGNAFVYVLSNGNYVVQSSVWNNGAVTYAGALTRCSGTAVCTGTVSPANSLVGSTYNDSIGSYGVIPLTNGGYVVNSPYWNNGAISDAGAATFCNAASGCTGVVSATNSLVGSTADDHVGITSFALTNGNYVTATQGWQNGALVGAGAVTFGNGTTGRVGAITSANSLVGMTAYEGVGSNIIALTNGNYVVSTPYWDNPVGPINNAGAATWCSGTSGCTGAVTAANSMTGSSADDSIGVLKALANGNYVVGSPYWDNHAPFAADAGAVAFCGSASGCVGPVTNANSLVGSTGGDHVGNDTIIALSNGNYVVLSSSWTNGPTARVGAATFCSGTTGCVGTITPGNSLIGSATDDGVGNYGVALPGGNYVVLSPNWKNGAISRAGAITRSGPSGITGTVTSVNSLVGSTMDDAIGGFGDTTALANGDYIVRSTDWDNVGIMDAGAISYGLGNGGTVGPITAANSVRGTIANGGSVQNFSFGSTNNQLVVGRPAENIVTVFTQGGIATPTPTPPPPTPTPAGTPTPTPTATPTPTPTPSPSPTPALVSISGTVDYCSNPTVPPVPSVTMTLAGTSSGSTVTDVSGVYTFSSLFSGGNYTVTPTKTTLTPGTAGINTLDVIAIQRHFLSLGPPLTGCKLTAADVNGVGGINTVDVIAVQRFFLGQVTGIANVGNYQFTPASRTYTGLTTNQTGQNYDALVFGDVAGSPFVH